MLETSLKAIHGISMKRLGIIAETLWLDIDKDYNHQIRADKTPLETLLAALKLRGSNIH